MAPARCWGKLFLPRSCSKQKQTTSEEQMKFNINKWTLGLAAVGAVSMASAVRADDAPKLSPVQTALSSTVISGYVSASANYQGNQTVANGAGLNSIGSTIPLQGAKANGFNLDVVKL